MKSIVITAIFIGLASTALASDRGSGSSTANAAAVAAAAATASASSSSKASANNSNRVSNSQRLNNKNSASNSNSYNNEADPRQAPAFAAPSLSASNEACMGSSSGGAGVSAGAVGISATFGTTWQSEQCERRMNGQQMRLAAENLPAQDRVAINKAVLLLLANDPAVDAALKAAGYKSPVTTTPVAVTPTTITPVVASNERHPACSARMVNKDGDFYKQNCM